MVLFRRDLRLADNGALAAVAGRPIFPVFVFDNASEGVRRPGSASLWWLHHSLTELGRDLAKTGLRLVIRRGRMSDTVAELVRETGARHVLWNRRHVPAEAAVDAAMRKRLEADGVTCEEFEGQLLHDPNRVLTAGGGGYRVYSPFWRALEAGDPFPDPIPAPETLKPFGREIESLSPEDVAPLPRNPDWAAAFGEQWRPGEAGAQARLADFLQGGLRGYAKQRDVPGIEGTSRLSPHLAWGEITPRQIEAGLAAVRGNAPGEDRTVFRKELAWREFSYHLLHHKPDLGEANFQPRFDGFRWAEGGERLKAWRRGSTGYPIVDAGMRELWRTGWMHNRVRMVVASFLTKHLLIDWREGEGWFWDTLVDADPANNAASWQWVAGTGADAAPYFRVFNPVLQGERFDPKGAYVRRHVPELARLPDKWLHKPWQAPRAILDEAEVRLGETYPEPIVDHAMARQRALDAYAALGDAA